MEALNLPIAILESGFYFLVILILGSVFYLTQNNK